MSTVRFTNEAHLQNFRQLQVQVDAKARTVWLYMNPQPRPCFTAELLAELRQYQNTLIQYEGRLPHEGDLVPIEYQVLTSQQPGVFNFGGDLNRFVSCIERKDRDGLSRYAKACIDVLHPNLVNYEMPITTISLVQGEALGGGFEAALSSDVIVAERGVQMGLPEVLFNLFPGMGAYQMLAQRIGNGAAERMILSGRMYSSEELYDMGIVTVLADPGEGVEALHAYRRAHAKRRNAHVAMARVRQQAAPVSYQELMRVCDIWVDAALNLSDKDLRVMMRLVRSQNRVATAHLDEPAEASLATNKLESA